MKTLLLAACLLAGAAPATAQGLPPKPPRERPAPPPPPPLDGEPLYVEPLAVAPASEQQLAALGHDLQEQAAHSSITLEPLCAEWITRDLAVLSQESAAAGLSANEAEAVNHRFLQELFGAFRRRDSTRTRWGSPGAAYGEADYTPLIGQIFTPTPILVINTSPAAAQVHLLTPQGPRRLGTTSLRKPLDCGVYTLKFSKPGYRSVTKTIVARRYPREQIISLKLPR